jgi:hypothetical protein
MKKASDILKDMAFNKSAPNSTQDAFLKNLQKHLLENSKAEVIPIPEGKTNSNKQILKANNVSRAQQLEFDFSGTIDTKNCLKKSM